MMICGMLPSSAITLSRSIVSLLPTISDNNTGRYFSTLRVGSAVMLCNVLGKDDRIHTEGLPWHLVTFCIAEFGGYRHGGFTLAIAVGCGTFGLHGDAPVG